MWIKGLSIVENLKFAVDDLQFSHKMTKACRPKRHKQRTVAIKNCTGLDQVNKENDYNDDIEIKSKSRTTGEYVGMTAIAAAAGVPRLLSPKVTGSGSIDDDSHVE